jgi:hypothetical protein
MSIFYMLLIALFAGCLGGILNYYLPANNPPGESSSTKIRPTDSLKKCIVLGLGATLMVPLFLELAKSKLMEGITYDWTTSTIPIKNAPDTTRITLLIDSAKRIVKSDTLAMCPTCAKIVVTKQSATGKVTKIDTIKAAAKALAKPESSNAHAGDYLIWLSYCLIAAASGFKFINMLLSKVVTEAEANSLKNKVKELSEADRLNKIQNQKNQHIAEVTAYQQISKSLAPEEAGELVALNLNRQFIVPNLMPSKYSDDTQKGRFMGASSRNNRILAAEVFETGDPDFFEVHFSVRSLDDQPLPSDVIFYIDSTFSPSVITISKFEIDRNNGVAKHKVEAWGAFTIGAITDFGDTLLELDLASAEVNAPKKFKIN